MRRGATGSGGASVLPMTRPTAWLPRTPLRLPVHWADDVFGLALRYNRFCYYDPSTGRCLSRDSIGVVGGLNLYLYAGNGPVNRADPLGLWWKTPLAILAGAVAAVAVVLFAPVIPPAIGIAAGTMLAACITTVVAGAAADAVGFAQRGAEPRDVLRLVYWHGGAQGGRRRRACIDTVPVPADRGWTRFRRWSRRHQWFWQLCG